jgi:ribosome biogenesis GTPase A
LRDAWSIVKRVVKEADVVLEVVDARDPMATRSRELERMVAEEGKKLVIVINKADLVPREVLEGWKRVLSREYPTIYISARERLGTRFLWRTIKRLTDKRPVVVAVVGLPNVGKSTILNVLRGRHSVSTSPVPGWTKRATVARATTWLKVIDTPGVVPRGEEEELAVRGALRPESLEDPVPAALKLIEVLKHKEPDFLKKYYGVEESDPMRALEELARRRNLLKKGGEPNVEEAARLLIRDWQSDKLVVCFSPEDYGFEPRRNLTKEAARGVSEGNNSTASSTAREGSPPSS